MAFPGTATLYDDYGRANGTVQTGAGSTLWKTTGLGGGAQSWVISDGSAFSTNPGDDCLSANSVGPDRGIEVYFRANGADYFALFFNLQNADTSSWEGYWLISDGVNVQLKKRIGGVSSTLATAALASKPLGLAVSKDQTTQVITAYYLSGTTWTSIVTATDASFASGPFAMEIGTGSTTVEEVWTTLLDGGTGGGGTGGGTTTGGTGPAGVATVYVNYDLPAASDTHTRGDAIDPTTPYKTIQRAIDQAHNGDTIRVVPITTTIAPFPAPVYPYWVAEGGIGVTAQNLTIVGFGGQASLSSFSLTGRTGYTFDNVSTGKNLGVASNSGVQGCTDTTFKNCHFYNGGCGVNAHGGTLLVQDCTINAPYYSGSGGFLEGNGFRIIANFFQGGPYDSETIGDVTFRRVLFDTIQGEDAVQFIGSGASGLGHTGTLLFEECHWNHVVQGEAPSAPHTDAIQIIGADNVIVRQSVMENTASMFINTPGTIEGDLTIENNLFVGPGGAQMQICGVDGTFTFAFNTGVNSGVACLDLGVTYLGATWDGWHIYNNAIDIYVLTGAGMVPALGVTEGNVFGYASVASTGASALGLTDLHGFPDYGTSADTDWELARSPSPTIGYRNGVVVSGMATVDRLGRARDAAHPSCGCHEPVHADVVANTRPIRVLSTSPGNGASGVSHSTNVTVAFSTTLGTTINPASFTSSTIFVRDPNFVHLPATITADPATNVVTLDITGFLLPYVNYRGVVIGGASGVKDSAGAALPNDFVFDFSALGQFPAPALQDADSGAGSTTWTVGCI